MRVWLFGLFFILIITFACNKKSTIPQQVFGFNLRKKVIGKEAKSYVDKIHFEDVASDKNEIFFYEGDEGSAIIYMTIYYSNVEAEREWKRMTEKISPEYSVFIMGTMQEIHGKSIYRCFGLGQTHYVFAHENRLLWVSIKTDVAKDFLDLFMEQLV